MSSNPGGSVIVAGARTPIGRLLGGLKDQSAADLGGVAIKGALEKAGVSGIPPGCDSIRAATGPVVSLRSATGESMGLAALPVALAFGLIAVSIEEPLWRGVALDGLVPEPGGAGAPGEGDQDGHPHRPPEGAPFTPLVTRGAPKPAARPAPDLETEVITPQKAPKSATVVPATTEAADRERVAAVRGDLDPCLRGRRDAVDAGDLEVMAADGTGLIWSPRSNVSLYGDTVPVTAAARLGPSISPGRGWQAVPS